jgi:hypothetical protein
MAWCGQLAVRLLDRPLCWSVVRRSLVHPRGAVAVRWGASYARSPRPLTDERVPSLSVTSGTLPVNVSDHPI